MLNDEVTQESTFEDDPFHSSEKTPSIFGISRFWTVMLTQKDHRSPKNWPTASTKKPIHETSTSEKHDFLREVFPQKKHHKHTGRLNHHLKPLRGDGENRSGITSSGSLILKM